MKLRYILTAVITTVALVSCKNTEIEKKISGSEENEIDAAQVEVDNTDVEKRYTTAEFVIEGMLSETGCAATIQKNIENLEGVKSADVNFDTKMARVEYDDEKLNFDDLAITVTTSGDGETYSIGEMKNIDESTKTYNKECCKGKTDAEKATCMKKCSKMENEHKTTCVADCKKDCCAQKNNR